MPAPRLVCILGAECTGKTTLARGLSAHFSGLWVPEILREFCDTHGRTPRCDEQQLILQTQLAREDEALAKARREGITHVFCDTCSLITALYSDFYFSDSSLLEPAHVLHRRYALTLLLAPDLPWQADGTQRDGVAVQSAVHARVLQALQTGPYPCVTVSGQGSRRAQIAVEAVNRLSA